MKTVNKRHIAGYILRYAVLGSLAVIAGVSCFFALGSRLGNRPPMPFGIGASTVLSGSMAGDAPDSLDVGDLIFYTEADRYEVGDVVVYPSGKITVVHRIVRDNGETVVTKGDANNSEDEPIERGIIYGKVRLSVPGLGYVALWLKTPLGLIVTVSAAVLLIEISNLAEKKKKAAEAARILAEIDQLREESRKQ